MLAQNVNFCLCHDFLSAANCLIKGCQILVYYLALKLIIEVITTRV